MDWDEEGTLESGAEEWREVEAGVPRWVLAGGVEGAVASEEKVEGDWRGWTRERPTFRKGEGTMEDQWRINGGR